MAGLLCCSQERIEQLRQQRETSELAECTFRPQINKNSDLLMMERAEALKVGLKGGPQSSGRVRADRPAFMSCVQHSRGKLVVGPAVPPFDFTATSAT